MSSTNHLDFEIDGITNSIVEVSTGNIYNTEVLHVQKQEIDRKEWLFNWQIEINNPQKSVFKLITTEDVNNIQGLISIQFEKGFVFMHLLENAAFNKGKKKVFIGVAGNLVAYACKLSFDMGYDGFVVFDAKSELVHHYQLTLNAEILYGQRMFIAEKNAKKLVDSYFK